MTFSCNFRTQAKKEAIYVQGSYFLHSVGVFAKEHKHVYMMLPWTWQKCTIIGCTCTLLLVRFPKSDLETH